MIFFPLEELNETCRGAAVALVKKYEAGCVQLSSVMEKNGKTYVCFLHDIAPRNVFGVLNLGKTVLHCLPFLHCCKKNGAEEDDFATSLAEFYMTEKLSAPSCVNGLKSGSLLVLKSLEKLGKIPDQTNEYLLMKLDLASFRDAGQKPMTKNEKIFRCRAEIPPKLFDGLHEIQKNYEKEEVVPDCFDFNEAASRLKLRETIRKHCVLALQTEDGKIVAKAGTNAVGLRCVQIGGVYTAPSHRRMGYGHNTVLALVKKILASRKMPVLYVKKRNSAAISMYSTLKFKKFNEYIIAYFAHNL